MIRRLGILIAACVALGCQARSSAEQAPRTDRSILTAADLTVQHFQNAYEAVETLRSNWLLARGPDSFNNPSVVWVYLDNVKLGGVETLRTVNISSIARIQHFSPVDATGRWGVGHGAGVILLSTMAQPGLGPPPTPPSGVSVAVTEHPAPAATFTLSSAGRSTPIVVSGDDHAGVIRAANDLKADVGRVTGAEPALTVGVSAATTRAVIVGTIGVSPIIDALVRSGKLDVTGVTGKWESYLRQVVVNPTDGVGEALVIAGSDKRGTIYGIYDLSSAIGVSPWYWWADVPVRKQAELRVADGRVVQGEPAVKYRGIFINDEAPAFSGWTREKFGGFNSAMYTRMFELILRMKGNYLWPAMWGNAFADDDSLNAKFADEHGIVMGTSHHEPMTRAQAEWRRYGKGEWNYEKNDTTLRDFWRRGIVRMGTRENIVTLGMRGDGDMPMTEGSNIALLERIVADQRRTLAEVTGRDAAKTPTLWALYKEVQDYYDKGMRVPDDVTLLFADDNWGNIRRLPPATDPERAGGYGVYYHFDYVGGPRNYKWLNTNPIARVWQQMQLAHDHGAKRIWIVNVGDLKPMEFPTQFFLDFAWNPSRWPAAALPEYTRHWAQQQFGTQHAAEIAAVVTTTLKYAGRRKPEMLSPDTYSLANYGEADRIVAEYASLKAEAERIGKLLAPEFADAYYQLVLHPVLAAGTVNELYVTVARNRLYAAQGRAATNDLADRARALFDRDADISRYFNTQLAGGKWSHMMDQTHIGYTYWQEPPRNVMPRVDIIQVPAPAEMGVAWEGQRGPGGPPQKSTEPALPEFDSYVRQTYWLDVYNRGGTPFDYTINAGAAWIQMSPAQGRIEKETRVAVSVDWSRAPTGQHKVPLTISGSDGRRFVVQAHVRNPSSPKREDVDGFVASNGVVSMEAEHYTRAVAQAPRAWLRIPDLGRTLSGMTVSPLDASGVEPGAGSPKLEYRMVVFDSGAVTVRAYFSPMLNFSGSARGVRYGMSIDDEPPQIVNITADSSLRAWEQTVGDNVTIGTTTHRITRPGAHVLSFWSIDPGVVLQKIVVDLGGLRPSYLGPPESYRGVREGSRR